MGTGLESRSRSDRGSDDGREAPKKSQSCCLLEWAGSSAAGVPAAEELRPVQRSFERVCADRRWRTVSYSLAILE